MPLKPTIFRAAPSGEFVALGAQTPVFGDMAVTAGDDDEVDEVIPSGELHDPDQAEPEPL